MDRIPVLDVEEREALAENLSFVICLNSETLLGISASTQTLLQLTQDRFNHCMPQIAVAVFYSCRKLKLSKPPSFNGARRLRRFRLVMSITGDVRFES